MAMLFSVMSFAQVVTFSPANETAVESKEFTLTSGDVTLVCSSGTITADQFRFFKSQTVTISSTGGKIVSIEFTCTASGTSKYGPGCFTANSGDYTSSGKVGTWIGEANEVKFTASTNQVRATQVVVTLLAAGGVPQPSIQGATDFIESAEVSIVASEGLKVYYTLDGIDPTTESTEYTAPFTVEETTTVKAIAHDGTNASDVTETTFTKATKVTCAEAAEIASQLSGNNVLSDLYYVVVGYVTELDGTISNGQQKFWVSDTKGGANTLYSYWCNVPQELVVGDYIQMFGKLTKYNEKNQMKNGDVTLAEEPVIEEPTIECKDALDFGAVVYTDEVEGQTLEVAGYNLTSDITVTLSDDVFTVNKTTLPAEGGELVVTPATPLTVGAHSATLTLTSGEATAEVALTVVAKDVYTITWSVNGETSTTTVVEGDKLVLPAAPEAPEACSEKVFVGWTAAEEVNADGSEIEWVTAAIAPTAAATYYAVFAVQEGEGTLQEGQVTLAYAGGTTGNLTTGNNASTVGLDANLWNVAANKGSANNNVGVNKDNDIRLYWHAEGSNTLTVTSLVDGLTITTILITYTGDSYSNAGVLVNSAAVSGVGGSFTINANSFTITNNNTSSAQVRIKNIVINYTTGAAATYTDYSTTCEAEIEWMEMPLEINNLITEVMEVGGAKYLMMMGGNEEMGKSVNIFLNNYADVDDDYEVNAESSLIVFMGYEFTVLEGTISQTSETEKGTLYTGTVSATGIVDGETMYVKFDLTMYAAPTTVLVLTNAIVAINEELETLTFNVPTGEGEGYFVELSGYTAPGVHEGAQICLFETPEVVAYATYVETEVVDGVITLTGEFTSPMGPKFDLTISGKLPGGSTVGLENLDTTIAPAKAIVNGQLVIVKDGVQYNATGAVVK